MKKVILSPEIQERFNHEKWIIENGIFIKRSKSRSCIDSIYLIDENRDKLTPEYFAHLDYLYVDNDDDIYGFGSKFYHDYQTFYSLYLDLNINKSQIIREAINAVLELRSIGINYKDIHSKNIIVNSESHMKLVDLDEANLLNSWDDDMLIIRRFIDLMLESMLFFDVKHSIWCWLSPIVTLSKLENKDVLSSSFLNFIVGEDSLFSFISNVDMYLQELSDEEKIFVLRKEIKDKYPKWFVK